jgi:hypothetical protein
LILYKILNINYLHLNNNNYLSIKPSAIRKVLKIKD